MMTSLAAMTAFIFITFFSPSMPVILVGHLLSIPRGIFTTTVPAYAVEVAPMALRGYLTAYINLCFFTGQLISAGVLKALVTNTLLNGVIVFLLPLNGFSLFLYSLAVFRYRNPLGF